MSKSSSSEIESGLQTSNFALSLFRSFFSGGWSAKGVGVIDADLLVLSFDGVRGVMLPGDSSLVPQGSRTGP